MSALTGRGNAVLPHDYGRQQAEDCAAFEAAKLEHETNLDTKRYLSRMRDDYKARAIKRGEELAKKEEVNKKIEEEKAKSRAQVLKQREEEREKREEEEKKNKQE